MILAMTFINRYPKGHLNSGTRYVEVISYQRYCSYPDTGSENLAMLGCIKLPQRGLVPTSHRSHSLQSSVHAFLTLDTMSLYPSPKISIVDALMMGSSSGRTNPLSDSRGSSQKLKGRDRVGVERDDGSDHGRGKLSALGTYQVKKR